MRLILDFSFKISLLILLLSCSGEEQKYGASEMWSMAAKFDPSIELVPITDPSRRILCEHYGEGCVKGSGKRIKVRKVELIVVMYQSESLAKADAKRLNQYYARNWLFDDVTEEPVLVDFVKKVFNAKNPHLENNSSK